MEAFYEDILGDFGFRVVWTRTHDHSVDVDVYEIVARDEMNRPMFGDLCDDADQPPKTYVSGFLKWDACCHFYFGEADNSGYIHICGPENFKKHIELFQYLLKRAPEILPAADESMWAA